MVLASNLEQYAAEWVDMASHHGALTTYARECEVVIEWGVRGGVSTWALLDGLPPHGMLWSVDILPCEVPMRVVSDQRWRFVVGDDVDPAVRAQLPSTADLVFIDTSHTYEQTTAELEIVLEYSPKRIVMHDVDQPQVRRAVDEFLARTGWRLVSYQDPYGFTVLEP